MDKKTKEMHLQEIRQVIEEGPYTDDWKSLVHFTPPSWFQKAKFGIFIHWGLYSIPAFNNEWYSRNMYIQGREEFAHHVKTYGKHTDFGYKDFIGLFRAEKFNPKEWVNLFKEAGAKYIFAVAEHHDGFQMYRSGYSHYNSYEMGPKRDILGELKSAVEGQDMIFCTSSHRAEHWFFMGHGKEFESDVCEPLQCGDFYWPAMWERSHEDLQSHPYPDEEFLTDWLLRTCEIIDYYKPKMLYFDWWVQHEAFKPYLKKVAAYYYNRGEQWGVRTAICYKQDAFMFGSGIVEIERGKFAGVKPYPWQTDTAIAKNSWCYTESLEYKTSRQIICNFVDVISKNGNMLLNIGPKGDGSIPDMDKKILREIGEWIGKNQEAIYNSRVWRIDSEGLSRESEGQFTDNEEPFFTRKDIRFTTVGACVYAFVMKYPGDGNVTIHSFAQTKDQDISKFHGLIEGVSILGYEELPVYRRDVDGLHIKTISVNSEFPVVIKITLK